MFASRLRLTAVLSAFAHPRIAAPTHTASLFMGSKMSKDMNAAAPLAVPAGHEVATFAAGCFWGVEKCFRKQYSGKGLDSCQVGYIGGTKDNVTYREVCSGSTGHAEAIQLVYDPSKITYTDLVDFFYRMHEPTTLNRQGNDQGTQYRSAIFYHDESQKKIAHEVTALAQTHFKSTKIQTTIEPATKFWPAEGYHQEYLHNNPNGYECATHFVRTWEKIEALHK
eukprot:jgi/Hompol1/2179/HPOL_001437-RA